jgi:probable rRNA maturation factor
MHALNLEHRGKDKATDVLSFALFEGEAMPFPGEDLALGDLVISVETAARQARELGHDLRHEMAFLAIHGALHLLGYDHIRDADRRVMWKWQEQIWEEWKVK